MRLIATLIALMLAISTPAYAHDSEVLEAWEQQWTKEVSIALTPSLLAERQEMEERHPTHFGLQSETYTPQRIDWGQGVEEWRPLVAGHFRPEDVSTALCIMWYESRGDPTAKNPKSTASGLFQILRFWWGDTFDLDPFIPEHNVYMAAQIRDLQGWSAWNPYQRGECR